MAVSILSWIPYISFYIFTLTLDTRMRVSERDSVPAQSATDTRDRRSAENQKYYATIHKVGLTNSEKIPGK